MGQLDSSAHLRHLLALHQAGHDGARAALLEHALNRCQHLARRMFHRHAALRVLHQTDDVLQEALVRLHRALVLIKPATVASFYGLAARQIRWVLQDLARKAAAQNLVYTGGTVPGPHPEQEGPEDGAGEPSDFLAWAEFHDRVEGLPEDERAVFDLLVYDGLTQEEAAEVLHLSLRTVKRRWQRARLLLRAALRGEWPE